MRDIEPPRAGALQQGKGSQRSAVIAAGHSTLAKTVERMPILVKTKDEILLPQIIQEFGRGIDARHEEMIPRYFRLLYFFEVPFELSTGYFSRFTSSFLPTTSSREMPRS